MSQCYYIIHVKFLHIDNMLSRLLHEIPCRLLLDAPVYSLCQTQGSIALMRHDKKNMSGVINFTLLDAIGDVLINQTATDEEIREALDFFREG